MCIFLMLNHSLFIHCGGAVFLKYICIYFVLQLGFWMLRFVFFYRCGEIIPKREQFNDLSIDLPRRKKPLPLRSVQDSLDLFFRVSNIFWYFYITKFYIAYIIIFEVGFFKAEFGQNYLRKNKWEIFINIFKSLINLIVNSLKKIDCLNRLYIWLNRKCFKP